MFSYEKGYIIMYDYKDNEYGEYAKEKTTPAQKYQLKAARGP